MMQTDSLNKEPQDPHVNENKLKVKMHKTFTKKHDLRVQGRKKGQTIVNYPGQTIVKTQ